MAYTLSTDYVTSIRNQKSSPLFRLPAELRNKIFTYNFAGYALTVANHCYTARVTDYELAIRGHER